MKTKTQRTFIGRAAMVMTVAIGGTFLVSCNGAEAEDEGTTDSDVTDVVDTDSVEVIDEPIDTFTIAPDLIETTVEEGIDEVNELND